MIPMRLVAVMLAFLGAPLAHAADAYPPASIYHLQAGLTDQDGRAIGLDVHRDHPVLVTMFYSSCQATCPLIFETLRAAEKALSADQRAGLRVLMISLDPEHDDAAALAGLARARRVDTARWTLARGDASTVRKIAALLDVQYRPLPGGGMNHSTVIAALSPRGETLARSSTLGRADDVLLTALKAMDRGAAAVSR